VQSEDVSNPVVDVRPRTDPEVVSLTIAPNPTAGPARISFDLERAGATRVEIYDVSGRQVRRLDLGALEPRTHRVVWDGRDANGTVVADGVYLTRVVSGGEVAGHGRVVVVR
jgi:hypothetical protein